MSDGTAPEDTSRPASCPACGGTRFTRRRLLPELTTFRCGTCGLLVGRVQHRGPAVAEFALVDQRAYLRSVGASRQRQARDILDRLAPRAPTGAKILDVGCSFGFFLLAARRLGFQIEGVEPDPDANAFARRLLGNDLIHPGILTVELARTLSADVVTTLDVVEHIPVDEHPVFVEMVRSVLKPGGIWVIKVPSTEGLYYKVSDLLIRTYPRAGAGFVRRLWQTRYEYPHLTYFSLTSLTRWLDRFGYDVVDHRYLPEVPSGTVIDRLTTDGDINRATAYGLAPAVLGATLIDSARGKSDSLVVFAQSRS